MRKNAPNVVFVFGDQHRFCDVGFLNPQVKTPFLDRMKGESLHMKHAISGMPVCSPYRASLMTGLYPLSHGMFLNDACLECDCTYLAENFSRNGYETAYIGKWHLDGHGRSNFIPKERRRGFTFWNVLECTHNYNHSRYYGDGEEPKYWEGYDVFAQTDCASDFIRHQSQETPFFLMLSYGPPHNPYQTAPEEFRRMYPPKDIVLRENVPKEQSETAREDIAGYYAHISAIDAALEGLDRTIRDMGFEDNTIFIYTSDHGDMLHSQGQRRKQRPWDESIRVPFLLRYPHGIGKREQEADAVLNSPDIYPTLLGLCGLTIPQHVEGKDFSPLILGKSSEGLGEYGILECVSPFGEYTARDGGREYRGIRTRRYTYVADRSGDWLLYDNREDPFQLVNRIGDPGYMEIRDMLHQTLFQALKERGDEFQEGASYIQKWGYSVDETGTIPYTE